MELVNLVGGIPVVTSKEIADNFGKTHKDVLRAINLVECSDEFRQRNFAPSSYTSKQNKNLSCFNVTRDGFAFLCMGFTGSRASKFKEGYILAFNKMEVYLKTDEASLSQQIHRVSIEVDQIAANGSSWGKTGSAIRKAKRAAIDDLNDLIDKAQLRLGF